MSCSENEGRIQGIEPYYHHLLYFTRSNDLVAVIHYGLIAAESRARRIFSATSSLGLVPRPRLVGQLRF